MLGKMTKGEGQEGLQSREKVLEGGLAALESHTLSGFYAFTLGSPHAFHGLSFSAEIFHPWPPLGILPSAPKIIQLLHTSSTR